MDRLLNAKRLRFLKKSRPARFSSFPYRFAEYLVDLGYDPHLLERREEVLVAVAHEVIIARLNRPAPLSRS